MSAEVSEGDVIQIEPGASDWAGACFAVVTEVKAWGVVCDVLIPQQRGEPAAVAPLRLENGKFVRIGQAEWLIARGTLTTLGFG